MLKERFNDSLKFKYNMDSVASWSYFELMLLQTQKNKHRYCFLNIIIFIQNPFVYPSKNFA